MVDPADDEILKSIKQPLGLDPEFAAFDFELLLHTNSVISVLKQLGVGPESGLVIDKDTKWSALLVNNDTHQLEGVKSYIFLRVKMLFDSNNMPAHLVTAYQEMIREAEFRIQVAADPNVPQLLLPEGE